MRQNNENEINIFDITNYIIINFSKKYEFTQMKLQKIIFYIYVDYLLMYKRPLVHEVIEAWPYGPVFPNLYLSLMRNYNKLIVNPINNGDESKITNEYKTIIDRNIEKYGSWSVDELVTKVHDEKAWKNNFLEADWSMNVISDKDLYKYYYEKPKRTLNN